MFLCICSVIDHKRRQNVVGTWSKTTLYATVSVRLGFSNTCAEERIKLSQTNLQCCLSFLQSWFSCWQLLFRNCFIGLERKEKLYFLSRTGKEIALCKLSTEPAWLQNNLKLPPAFVSEITGSDQGTPQLPYERSPAFQNNHSTIYKTSLSPTIPRFSLCQKQMRYMYSPQSRPRLLGLYLSPSARKP